MESGIRFHGAVVERQAYLDGASTFTIEAHERNEPAGAGWSLLLTLRWDPVTGAGIEEGDLTLSRGTVERLGTAIQGEITAALDDDQGDEILTLAVEFDLITDDDEESATAERLTLRGVMTGDEAELTVLGLVATTGDGA